MRDLEDDCGALQRRCADTERRYGGLANDGVREGYKKEKERRLLASQGSWGLTEGESQRFGG